jgi:acyl-CoA synthetase (AMP-forming)/AMP-acid ligase II
MMDLPGGSGASTLAAVLRRHGATIRDRVALTYLERGESPCDQATFGDLDISARQIAGFLFEAGLVGKPVLLAIGPGLDFVRCFLGCLYAGVLAVPVPALSQRRGRARIAAILSDVEPAGILASGLGVADAAWLRLVGGADDRPIQVFDVSDALAGRAIEVFNAPHPDAPAYIQYTSGSTSDPKGVVISHRNIMANLAMIEAAFGENEAGVGVSWLPHYNDMGLVGCILQPLFLGARCILMSPLAFLQQPLRWLRAIDRYRATASGAPNFAYDLCARHIKPEQLQGLDLSSWRMAFCGSEPIRLDTMMRFAKALRPAGFREQAIYPCYGLAEATLLATGGRPGSGIRSQTFAHRAGRPQQVVACGRPWLDARCVILDPERLTPSPPNGFGEICVAGDHVSPGLWSSERGGIVADVERQVTIEGQRFLRTGDLGAIVDDELFVVGRLKDVIISRGTKLCAEDIERTIASLPETIEVGTAAAFSIDDGIVESLVVVCETTRNRMRSADHAALLAALSMAVAEAHGILPADVAIVPPNSIQRTSNGKVQRSATREHYQQGQLKIIASLRGTSAADRAAKEALRA